MGLWKRIEKISEKGRNTIQFDTVQKTGKMKYNEEKWNKKGKERRKKRKGMGQNEDMIDKNED